MDDKNWVSQQLHLLLTAYGYNLYNDVNRARADDLLVRQKAAGSLSDAAHDLARLATEFTARCIPPSTREQPFPPPEKMALLRQLESLRDESSVLAAKIRGMSVPTQDRTWARFRLEAHTLEYLLSHDYQLITAADAVQKAVESLVAETWSDPHAAEIRTHLHTVEQLARDRERFLQAPV